MAKFTKQSSTGGAWIKPAEIEQGARAKLVSEATPVEGQFGTQTVAKIRVEGMGEAVNINLNKPTVNALVDAFGEESKDWCNQPLTIQTEKMMVSGRRVTAVYLIPKGYKLDEDEGGYLVITPGADAVRTPRKEVANPDEDTRDVPVEAYEEENW